MFRIEYLVCLLVWISCSVGKPLQENVTCGYDACPVTDTNALNVHLACHSHDDVGWLETVDELLNNYMFNIFGTVVEELLKDSRRKFVQTESSFLAYWWYQQTDEMKEKYRFLVNNGQIEIANGAWCSNDEAATHYQSIIDQFTLGHQFLEEEIGHCARTKAGWQVDTFGHSREMASLYAQMGFDNFMFARFHRLDIAKRKEDKTMDLLWIGSENIGVKQSNIFTSAIYNHYSHPAGFCYDQKCDDPEINDDNWEDTVKKFADYVTEQSSHYTSNNILVTMGDDFQYQNASKNYRNIDKLIEGFEKFSPTTDDGRPIKVYYSSPSCYAKAVNDYIVANDKKLSVKYDDFLPHSHTEHEVWTGFYTSRPTSKRYERTANNILQISKQLTALSGRPRNSTYALENAVGVMQHHDAITGTERETVKNDYNHIISEGISKAIPNIQDSLSALLGENLGIEYCPLANSSICSATSKDEFDLLIYNPLSRVISEHIQVPVNGDSWTITDPEGKSVPYFSTKPIREFSEIGLDLNSDIIIFKATLPALGYNVYNVKKTDANEKLKSSAVLEKVGDGQRVGFEKNNIVIEENGLVSQFTVQGISVSIRQEYLYYISEPTVSNPWIFTPNFDNRTAQTLSESVSYTIGEVENGVVEIKQQLKDWVTQIIRIYENTDYIELDWCIGPLDNSTYSGVEVISRFYTDLNTDNLFYTDSNSRELMRRELNKRPTFEYTNEEPQSGNYFPVTTRAVLEDAKRGIQVAIITDRSEGVSSLDNGQLELMMHRCTLLGTGGDAPSLYETEYGIGVIARGSHYLTIGKPSSTLNTDVTEYAEVTQRKLAQNSVLRPLTLLLSSPIKTTSRSLLKTKLPENVHLLTLAKWNDTDDTYLVRLEHFYEKTDDPILSQEVLVDLSNLFTEFTIRSIDERTLSGVKRLGESSRLEWPQLEKLKSTENALKDDGLKIALSPMQIRTFVVTVARK